MADDSVGRARRLLLRAVETLNEDASQARAPVMESAPIPGTSSPGPRPRGDPFAERNRLFNFGKRKPPKDHTRSKKKKLSLWTHDFVCLSSTAYEKPPTSFQAGELMQAGLGKKSVSVLSFADSSELHDEIMSTFPALVDGGGYELLRAGEAGSRNSLVVIPQPPEGYTVDYLREVVRQAKVYIRPLQKDLPMEIQPASSSAFLVVCCATGLPYIQLTNGLLD